MLPFSQVLRDAWDRPNVVLTTSVLDMSPATYTAMAPAMDACGTEMTARKTRIAANIQRRAQSTLTLEKSHVVPTDGEQMLARAQVVILH